MNVGNQSKNLSKKTNTQVKYLKHLLKYSNKVFVEEARGKGGKRQLR